MRAHQMRLYNRPYKCKITTLVLLFYTSGWRKGWPRGHQYHCQGLCGTGQIQFGAKEAFESGATSKHHFLSTEDSSHTFTEDDFKGVNHSQEDPMVITVDIDNLSIMKTLVG